MALTKFQAVIVENTGERRMRLRAALSSTGDFERPELFNTLSDAESRFEQEPMVDIALISYEFPEYLLRGFIEKAKKATFGIDAAFVLVLPAKDQDSETVAKNVITGADGFLFEPYSVDQLDEIVKLAARVKKERSDARERAAFGLLLDDLLQMVDRASYLKSVEQDTDAQFKKIRAKAKMIYSLEGDRAQIYFETLTDKTMEAPLPRKIYQEKYKGASKRVRERMEKKLMEKLSQDIEND